MRAYKPAPTPSRTVLLVLVALVAGALTTSGIASANSGHGEVPRAVGASRLDPDSAQVAPVAMSFADDVTDAIVSDGLGTFVDGACGVGAYLNEATDDAILRFEKIRGRDQGVCDTDRRGLNFDFRYSSAFGGSMNATRVRAVTTVATRRVQFNIDPCYRLVFDPMEFPETDFAQVERLGPGTWRVHADQGFATARCDALATDVEMPFRVTIRLE